MWSDKQFDSGFCGQVLSDLTDEDESSRQLFLRARVESNDKYNNL